MITLSNGHRFEHMVASGALGFDGLGYWWEWPLRWAGLIDPRLFTVVTKTLSFEPIVGNLRWWCPWTCVRLIKNGVVNAVALTNPGYRWWVDTVAPKIQKRGIDMIVSLQAKEPKQLREMIRLVNPWPIKGIELNLWCPNTGDDVNDASTALRCVDVAYQESVHPIGVKISVAQPYRRIVSELRDVQWIGINSVPWHIVFPDRVSPLAHLGGGAVSGKPAQAHSWPMVRDLDGSTDIPTVGPHPWEFADLARLRALSSKVKAIGFGSMFLRHPGRPTAYVRRDMRNRCGSG